jgi:hypothetical protein
MEMSAEAISGGSTPKECPSASDMETSEYTKEAWDLLIDDVGMGRRNWPALESFAIPHSLKLLEQTDHD